MRTVLFLAVLACGIVGCGGSKENRGIEINDGVTATEKDAVYNHQASHSDKDVSKSLVYSRWSAEKLGTARHIRVTIEQTQDEPGASSRDMVFIFENEKIFDVLAAKAWEKQKDCFVRTRPVIEIAAVALAKAYQDNQVAADQQYLHRTLRVTGLCLAVRKHDDGEISLSFGVKGLDPIAFHMPRASFALSHGHEAARIKSDSTVTVQGDCLGLGEFIRSPVLRRCRLIAP